MADDKTTKTPEQPVTDSGPGKETPPAPPKEPEKVSVSPEPEKKTEPEVKNPQVSVYNFAEIMKEKKVEERKPRWTTRKTPFELRTLQGACLSLSAIFRSESHRKELSQHERTETENPRKRH